MPCLSTHSNTSLPPPPPDISHLPCSPAASVAAPPLAAPEPSCLVRDGSARGPPPLLPVAYIYLQAGGTHHHIHPHYHTETVSQMLSVRCRYQERWLDERNTHLLQCGCPERRRPMHVSLPPRHAFPTPIEHVSVLSCAVEWRLSPSSSAAPWFRCACPMAVLPLSSRGYH